MKTTATVFIGIMAFATAVVIVGACIVFVFFPYKMFGLLPRPMFCTWVGDSNTAWGREVPLRDTFGTWIYYDEELNIVVVLRTEVQSDYSPLHKCTSNEAVFVVNKAECSVLSKGRDKLYVVAPNGTMHAFYLKSAQGRVMLTTLDEEMLGPNRQSVRLFDRMVEVYDGQDRLKLLELAKGVEIGK